MAEQFSRQDENYFGLILQQVNIGSRIDVLTKKNTSNNQKKRLRQT